MGNFERRLEREGALDGIAPYDPDMERRALEQDEPEEESILPSIQNLIDTGMAWRLEGHVGRQCMAAIESGHAVLGKVGHRDYWGNYVPSRDEVEPGTKGSVGYAQRLTGWEEPDA